MNPYFAQTTTGDRGGIHPPKSCLPANARVGRVRIAVTDLRESLNFYTNVVGLRVLHQDARNAGLVQLGAHQSDAVLLELEGIPGARHSRRRTRLGLYHVAYLLPSRDALSSFVQHLTAQGISFGASDHLYSEALYLTDPDGFTVEVYADRPRETWTFEGRELLSGVYPLDMSKLPQVAPDSWKGTPGGTTIGHVHFFIDNLEKAKGFYHHGLGLDLMTWRYPGALFMAAGGYHHHVALNTWAAGSPLPEQGEARLLFWQLVLSHADEVEAVLSSLRGESCSIEMSEDAVAYVRDPWGIKAHLVVSG